ncbi:MAG TPA: protein-tyrosine phosphatase family protein [Acidimicrobiales bacterium]|nr:protein-tyrosine phosphatase family protein [Acidimicrobiales bacterium]
MALCLAESILDTQALDLDDQLRRYLLWADSGYLPSNGRRVDIGNTIGGAVYLHCWGGVGRTGTVVGCLLADEGLGHHEIVERIERLRAGTCKASRPSPETEAQRGVIERRAARRRSEEA